MRVAPALGRLVKRARRLRGRGAGIDICISHESATLRPRLGQRFCLAGRSTGPQLDTVDGAEAPGGVEAHAAQGALVAGALVGGEPGRVWELADLSPDAPRIHLVPASIGVGESDEEGVPGGLAQPGRQVDLDAGVQAVRGDSRFVAGEGGQLGGYGFDFGAAARPRPDRRLVHVCLLSQVVHAPGPVARSRGCRSAT